MSELVTLDSSDSRFKSYLWGTFSSDYRALPLKSLNINTQSEKITFQIKAVEQIEKPGFVKKWSLILRLQNWIYCLFPILLVLVSSMQKNLIHEPWLAASSALGAFSLFIAMNLRNDVNDHIRGLDRILPQSGNQAIQKGWVTAHSLMISSRAFFFLGIALGVPALVAYPQLLLVIGFLVLVSFWILTSEYFALKYRFSGEVIMFFIMGPLLTTGFQISFGGGFDLQTIFIGTLCGLISLFWIHSKNFLYVFENSQAQLENSISILGFEKAKKFLQLWWIAACALTLLYKYIYSSTAWLLITTVLLGVFSFPWYQKLRKYNSPVGSQSQSFLQLSLRLTQLWFAVWSLEILISIL